MSTTVPSLEVLPEINQSIVFDDVPNQSTEKILFCPCQTEYCNCGSNLGVTEIAAKNIYKHFGFTNGRSEMFAKAYRPNVLHIWGTHNLSTNDLITWLSDYKPKEVEWINDASCNIVFENESVVLRLIVNCSEPFNRQVALTAAAALASFLQTNTMESHDDAKLIELESMSLSHETLDSVEHFSQYLPPTGRWYKALSVPPKTISLFLRFAHSGDVKLPGAERRSMYYRRFGNPNYGGMPGILSRSYRRRLRTTRKLSTGDINGSLRHILPSNFAELIADVYFDEVDGDNGSTRSLVVYDNLYDESATKVRSGQRRNAKDYPSNPNVYHPRKWPRRDYGLALKRRIDDDNEFESPKPGSVIVFDPREPWGVASSGDPKPFIFTSDQRNAPTTVTLMPDSDCELMDEDFDDNNNDLSAIRRPLASMSMVADMEMQSSKSRSIIDRLGKTSRNRLRSYQNTKSNIWKRLG